MNRSALIAYSGDLRAAAGCLHGAVNAYSATYAATMAQNAATHLQARQAYAQMNALSAQTPTTPNRRSVITRMGFGGGREKRFRSLDREAA